MFKRVITIVMDSVGIGGAPDAENFGDKGADTVGHIEQAAGPIDCPTLRRLGLGEIANIHKEEVTDPTHSVMGIYGRLTEVSAARTLPVATGSSWAIR